MKPSFLETFDKKVYDCLINADNSFLNINIDYCVGADTTMKHLKEFLKDEVHLFKIKDFITYEKDMNKSFLYDLYSFDLLFKYFLEWNTIGLYNSIKKDKIAFSKYNLFIKRLKSIEKDILPAAIEYDINNLEDTMAKLDELAVRKAKEFVTSLSTQDILKGNFNRNRWDKYQVIGNLFSSICVYMEGNNETRSYVDELTKLTDVEIVALAIYYLSHQNIHRVIFRRLYQVYEIELFRLLDPFAETEKDEITKPVVSKRIPRKVKTKEETCCYVKAMIYGKGAITISEICENGIKDGFARTSIISTITSIKKTNEFVFKKDCFYIQGYLRD